MKFTLDAWSPNKTPKDIPDTIKNSQLQALSYPTKIAALEKKRADGSQVCKRVLLVRLDGKSDQQQPAKGLDLTT